VSEPEDFLSRWSRRKFETERTGEKPNETPREKQPSSPVATDPAPAGTDPPRTGAVEEPEPEFDVSTLPPIESIGIGTDIRSFLQKGVPLELTRAALRRAWVADPAIRDFIEVAENQWDFATGSDIPGFGALQPTDDVRRLVSEVFQRTAEVPPVVAEQAGKVSPQVAQDQSDLPPEIPEPGRELDPMARPEITAVVISESTVQRKEEIVAAQQEPKKSESRSPSIRGHGGALPQ
jgi:hypothetical protein